MSSESKFLRVLIDADGCPVVDETIIICKSFGLECLILCDTSHHFDKDGATTFTFSKGSDSVDFALVNMLKKGDIVVTQDYGLASMCLARAVRVLNQDGHEYTNDNIDALLLSRHTSKKLRQSGKRIKGQLKRTKQQDQDFIESLTKILSEGE